MRETIWKGDRGDGSIFFRLDAEGRRLSPSLYLSYRDRARAGREIVVSTGTADLAVAKTRLQDYRRDSAIPKHRADAAAQGAMRPIKRSVPKAGTGDPRREDERPARFAMDSHEAARALGVSAYTLERDDD